MSESCPVRRNRIFKLATRVAQWSDRGNASSPGLKRVLPTRARGKWDGRNSGQSYEARPGSYWGLGLAYGSLGAAVAPWVRVRFTSLCLDYLLLGLYIFHVICPAHFDLLRD